jgi:hypothetical protein
MAQELVCIYVSSDSKKLVDFERDFGWRMIEEKLARDVDLLERSSLFLNEKGSRKHSGNGRVLAIFADKANLEAIFARIRAVDPEAKAYAVPVLAAL